VIRFTSNIRALHTSHSPSTICMRIRPTCSSHKKAGHRSRANAIHYDITCSKLDVWTEVGGVCDVVATGGTGGVLIGTAAMLLFNTGLVLLRTGLALNLALRTGLALSFASFLSSDLSPRYLSTFSCASATHFAFTHTLHATHSHAFI